jgi:hypothetical protein
VCVWLTGVSVSRRSQEQRGKEGAGRGSQRAKAHDSQEEESVVFCRLASGAAKESQRLFRAAARLLDHHFQGRCLFYVCVCVRACFFFKKKIQPLQFCWAGDIVNCGRVSKGLYQVSINEQLWRAKLYADFEVCDELKAMPARQAYLKLASSNHPGCRPKFPGLSLVEVYHERAQKWLDESNKANPKKLVACVFADCVL